MLKTSITPTKYPKLEIHKMRYYLESSFWWFAKYIILKNKSWIKIVLISCRCYKGELWVESSNLASYTYKSIMADDIKLDL